MKGRYDVKNNALFLHGKWPCNMQLTVAVILTFRKTSFGHVT